MTLPAGAAPPIVQHISTTDEEEEDIAGPSGIYINQKESNTNVKCKHA
jgi:hypothetical protein